MWICGDFHMTDRCEGGSLSQCGIEGGEPGVIGCRNRFHPSIWQVGDPPDGTDALGDAMDVPAEPNALHPARDQPASGRRTSGRRHALLA